MSSVKIKKEETLGDRFRRSMFDVAAEQGKPPAMLSKSDYLSSDCKSKLTLEQLNKAGGFPKMADLYFPPERDIIVGEASKLVRGFRNKIQAQYGRDILLKDDFIAVFKEIIEKNPIKLHPPVKRLEVMKKDEIERSLVIHLSDSHFGCNIEPAEMNGLNEFNWTIAARRMALFIEQAMTYKPQHRKETELVVLINGDIIAGVIHDQEWAVDQLTTQFSGAMSILSQAISFAATGFKNVRVVCTPGNHGRAMHKASKDRATVHKWDSYENMLYIAIREALKSHKNVEFIIPESPYAIVEILGHKFLVTHGDTVINVGNPGKNLNMKAINEQINKLNAQLIKGDENFAAVICGHVHVSTIQETDSGTMLLINGTLSGLDPFAQSIGIFSTNATQTLFEVTRDHAVGDMRLIRLRRADKLEELDKVIEPFKGRF